jgi:hypothetical protein
MGCRIKAGLGWGKSGRDEAQRLKEGSTQGAERDGEEAYLGTATALRRYLVAVSRCARSTLSGDFCLDTVSDRLRMLYVSLSRYAGCEARRVSRYEVAELKDA